MNTTKKPLITCTDLSLGYEGKDIVWDLNFAVEEGDYLCIIGDNGAGKSTLLKGLLGLCKPTHGSITFREDLEKQTIGYLPQQPPLVAGFPASVYEVVLSGCLSSLGILPFYKQVHKETARKNMERLHITQLAQEPFYTLSGGQKQRVLIARALCATDSLLILDEPVTGLDPVATEELYQLIQELNTTYGIAIIMVSHDVSAVRNRSKKVLHLHHDSYFYGTAAQFFETDAGRRYLS
jgi:zinc transport system ATP-binding protein